MTIAKSESHADDARPSIERAKGVFTTTHWSVVSRAALDDPAGAAALEQLCRTYWYPLYAFVRRRGFGPPEAEDLTQSFFLHLLEKETMARADRRKGKFRSFLLAALTNFLANERDKVLTAKRGGGREILSLEDHAAEALYAREPADLAPPERVFDRGWAAILLERALASLRREYSAAGKARLFAAIEPGLTEEVAPSRYAEWAAELSLSEGAARVALHRLRRRFGEALRAEISRTVSVHEEVEEEIRALFASVAARDPVAQKKV